MFKPGDIVVMKKLRAAPNGPMPTAKVGDFQAGAMDAITGGSIHPQSHEVIPIDYEIRGRLISTVEPNKRIKVERSHRNGVAVFGEFTTSEVCSVEYRDYGALITTVNSVYEITPFGN